MKTSATKVADEKKQSRAEVSEECEMLSKKYVLLSTGNLSNKCHRDIIIRFFNRNICSLKNRANCPALLDIYVQFSGVGLGTKNCNLKIF